jgi:hypothetical protein
VVQPALASWGMAAASRDVAGATAAGRGGAAPTAPIFSIFLFFHFLKCFHS